MMLAKIAFSGKPLVKGKLPKGKSIMNSEKELHV